MLYENEVVEDRHNEEKQLRRLWSRKASTKLKNYYINGMTDEEAQELVEAAVRWSEETEEGRWQKAVRVHRNARWRFQRRYGYADFSNPRREGFRKITLEFSLIAETAES